MTPQAKIRAARDKALKTAIAQIGPEGHTALQIQQATGNIHRETLRALLESLVDARVLQVERSYKNNLYRPAHAWEEGFDAYVRARDERLGVRLEPDAADDSDDEPAPGVPLVLLAQRRMHPLHTVWGARP